MIEEMANLLENFPGAANQTRCFLHILNLTAKSILRQFEPPQKKSHGEETISKAVSELAALSIEIESASDQDSPASDLADSDDEGADCSDNEEGLEDECQDLSDEQITELEAYLIPVRLMLTKV